MTSTFTSRQLNLLRQLEDGSHLMYRAPNLGRFGKGGPQMFCVEWQRTRPLALNTFERFRKAGYIAYKPGSYEYVLTDAGRAALTVAS